MGQDDEPIGLFSTGRGITGLDSGIPADENPPGSQADYRWPTGHIGWNFANQSEFEARTTVFLAEGLSRREKLMFVSADPKPHLWPTRLLVSGVLQIASVAEVYGGAVVKSAQQKATFMDVLSAALDDGYHGIRVAADNTAMISTPEQALAWAEWEAIADELMAIHPITGLCGFDRSTCPPDRMREVMDLHRTHAPARPPQRRMPAPPRTRL